MVTFTRTVAVNVNETSGETPVVALVVTAVVVKERGQNVQPAVRAETELPGGDAEIVGQEDRVLIDDRSGEEERLKLRHGLACGSAGRGWVITLSLRLPLRSAISSA
jgi:hypothetical protein